MPLPNQLQLSRHRQVLIHMFKDRWFASPNMPVDQALSFRSSDSRLTPRDSQRLSSIRENSWLLQDNSQEKLSSSSIVKELKAARPLTLSGNGNLDFVLLPASPLHRPMPLEPRLPTTHDKPSALGRPKENCPQHSALGPGSKSELKPASRTASRCAPVKLGFANNRLFC